ncbi:MAG: hypothetical protein JSR24_23895 [Proteobacteria bacterium]|nr:hypothetical protein [Pseudomonadota bacterium]
MAFRVQNLIDGRWWTVAEAIVAADHHAAVARGASGAGVYRAQEEGREGFFYFDVPGWGPPRSVPAPEGWADPSSTIRAGSSRATVRPVAARDTDSIP